MGAVESQPPSETSRTTGWCMREWCGPDLGVGPTDGTPPTSSRTRTAQVDPST